MFIKTPLAIYIFYEHSVKGYLWCLDNMEIERRYDTMGDLDFNGISRFAQCRTHAHFYLLPRICSNCYRTVSQIIIKDIYR